MNKGTKRMLEKSTQALFLLALAIQISGCTAAAILAGGAAGAAGIIWTKGSLQETLNIPIAKAHKATVVALETFELPIQENNKDGLAARMKSRFADGAPLWISIDSVSESSTRISIRAGVFGNESRSRRLLEEIHRHI